MNQPKQDGLTILLFLCAIALSAAAAFYAVSGLVAIFAAAVIPIVVMGSLLEASKLVIASWLYRNWKHTSFLLRTYFCIALTVLMLLTSMGIFGYLSKAHLDQAVPIGDVTSKLSIIDEKIKTAKDNIDANRKALKQMDEAVDQVMGRSSDEKGAEKAVSIRRSQQKERVRLQSEIQVEQKTIAKYSEERAPIAAEVRKVEAEVGPIKYIAALIYGDNPDQNVLEKAVRVVIIMIVIVFDPMAVLMLIAVNQTLSRKEEHEPATEPTYEEETNTSTKTEVEPSPTEAKDNFASEAEDEPTTVSSFADQTPFDPVDPEASSQVAATPETEATTEPSGDSRESNPFDGRNINPTKAEPNRESVELVETIYQKINTTNNSDVMEILEKPTSGRPDRYK
jgi:hypothetical protein